MPFKFKLSKRLALIKAALAASAVLALACDRSDLTSPQPPPRLHADAVTTLPVAQGSSSPTTNSATSTARPDNRRRRNSPESRSIIAATVPLTCTSNATNVLACTTVGTPMIAVRAQATPEPQTRASHARVPTLTSRPDARAAVHRV